MQCRGLVTCRPGGTNSTLQSYHLDGSVVWAWVQCALGDQGLDSASACRHVNAFGATGTPASLHPIPSHHLMHQLWIHETLRSPAFSLQGDPTEARCAGPVLYVAWGMVPFGTSFGLRKHHLCCDYPKTSEARCANARENAPEDPGNEAGLGCGRLHPISFPKVQNHPDDPWLRKLGYTLMNQLTQQLLEFAVVCMQHRKGLCSKSTQHDPPVMQ